MRKSHFLGAALVASLSVASAAQAAINLLVNPGFETGIALPTGQAYLAANDTTSIFGWKVLSAGVHYVNNSVWDAASGSRSVELTSAAGTNGGLLQRVRGFVVGKQYTLSYRVSVDPANTALTPTNIGYTVSVTNGIVANPFYTFLPGINSATNMQYATATYNFIAGGTFMDLQFRARGKTNGFGPVIDNVSITAIPEASTWAMLVLGFGLVGIASRRRKLTSVTA